MWGFFLWWGFFLCCALWIWAILYQASHSGTEFHQGCPSGSEGKESVCKEGDPGSILGLGRTPGEGNGYTVQYSCLKDPMDRGAW